MNTNKLSAVYPRRFARSRARGFTYIVLLIVVAVMGILLASAGQVYQLALQREKERELLFAGDQFRRAITQYAKQGHIGAVRYPMKLEDLLQDPRTPNTRRYLRKIYNDPMSGKPDWGLLKGTSGEIFGVYSLSEQEPLKKQNFSADNAGFEDKSKYAEWVFMAKSVRYAVRPAVRMK